MFKILKISRIKMPRNLPTWMTKQSQAHVNIAVKSEYPVLTIPKSSKVIYCHQAQDCQLLCQEINNSLQTSGILSLDAEWPVKFIRGKYQKLAVLQLCTNLDRIYVFHISQIGRIPSNLKSLLEDSNTFKMGLNINGDLSKLCRDFKNISDMVLKNSIDLNSVAKDKLNSSENWSLARLCRHVLQQDLPKDDLVRKSSWDYFPLTEQQIQYAALDVYAGLLLYNKLQNQIVAV